MSEPLHILTYVDRPACWPTVIRADVYARTQRYLHPTRAVHHWIITFDGGVSAADCDRWGVQTAGVVTAEALVDAAQILIDRLLTENRAYAVGERIFFRWDGCAGYHPPQQMHGRQQPTDIQLWGPHWTGGPVGPSRNAVRWAAIFELAEERVDMAFGLNRNDANAHQLLALGCRIGVVEPALREAPSQRQVPIRYRDWPAALLRWTALQVQHDFRRAQGAHASAKAHTVRTGVRMHSLPDAPARPEHMRLLEHAEAALARQDWRDANRWLVALCKTVCRMGAGASPSRRMRNHVLALLDTLGL